MSNEAEFSFGDQIGDYEIMSKLGHGGMGAVYLAQHVFLKKRFALKILSSDLALVPEFVQVFQHEAQTLAALKHPNIVEIHHFGTHDGHYYFVMEYLNGGTLETYRMQEEGRLPPEDVLYALRAVSSGLRHAHAKGIIHRDLKPENFLLDSAGVVKISDFGLARLAKNPLQRSSVRRPVGQPPALHSQTYVYLAAGAANTPEIGGGTDGYVAPEVLAGKSADERGDIYSLGMSAWKLLTGVEPTPAMRPSQILPNLDTRWDKIIALCVHPDPRERYQTVEELEDDLNALAGVPRRHFPSWVWAIVVPIFAIIGVGAYLVYKEISAPPPVATSTSTKGLHMFGVNRARLSSLLDIKSDPRAVYGWRPGESARWEQDTPLPDGTYTATLFYSSFPLYIDTPVVVSVRAGQERLRATLPATTDWSETHRAELGRLQVAAGSEIVFRIESASLDEPEILAFRGLVLERVE